MQLQGWLMHLIIQIFSFSFNHGYTGKMFLYALKYYKQNGYYKHADHRTDKHASYCADAN